MTTSINIYTVDSVTAVSKQFAVNFTLGFLSRDHVTAFVEDELDGGGDQIFRTITWINDGLVTLSGTLSVGNIVKIQRTTPADNLIHDFQAGAVLREGNLDEAHIQPLMILHEVFDGRNIADFVQNLNMNGFDIENAGTIFTDFINIGGFVLDPSASFTEVTQTATGVPTSNGTNVQVELLRRGSIPVNTLNDVRALDKNVDKYAVTSGYTSVGDGGGAAYYFDSTDITSTDDGFLCIVATDGGRWKLNHSGIISVRWAGALGDYTTDDTSAIDAAIAYAAPAGLVVDFDAGVYRYTGTLDLPAGVKIRGAGAPKIAAYPQASGDKAFLRPGYKHLLPGASIIFDGTGTTSAFTTARADKFASVTPMVKFPQFGQYAIEGIGFIQDMDVKDAGGSLTDGATDNRATAYTGGFMARSILGYFRDVTIFGYFDDAGTIIVNDDGTADPDYNNFSDCLLTSGVAIIGEDTNPVGPGLTGTRFVNCGIYGADHHDRDDGLYTVNPVFIDGLLSSSNIRSHAFVGCNIRGLANDFIHLDACTDINFVGCTYENPARAGVTDADAVGVVTGTANTNDVRFVAGGAGNDLGLDDLAGAISGRLIVVGSGSLQSLMVANAGKGVRLSGDSGTGDSRVQLTDDFSSNTSGWLITRDDSASDKLALRYDNSKSFELTTGGDGLFTGSVSGGTLNTGALTNKQQAGAITISSGSISVDPGNGDVSIDTEGAAGTDDLTTLSLSSGSPTRGQMLVLRTTSSARDVVFKHGSANIICEGGVDFTLAASSDQAYCMYDGNNWRCHMKSFA